MTPKTPVSSSLTLFLKLPVWRLLALLGTLGLSSCKPDSAPQAGSSPVPEVLRLLTWEDYIPPNVLAKFSEETGVLIEYTSIENTEDLIGTLRAYGNRHDLVIIDNSSISRIQSNQLLQPLDHSRIKGIENLDLHFLGTENDPDNKYSLPYLWGTTLVAYRNDRISDPEPSFELLFDEKLKGHVLMLDDMYDSLSVPLLMGGHSINEMDEEVLRSAGEKLAQAVKSTKIRFASDTQIREALASGDAWAALCYSGDAAFVAESHPEVSFFLPKEGMAMWLDVMAISREAANVEAAHEFINFMLRPEIAAETAHHFHYFTPNRSAKPLLEAKQAADNPLVIPDELLKKLEFFAKNTPKQNEIVSKIAGEIREQERANR